MIIEQSFYSLPEILHGSGYQTQSYESGLVTAFTLSLLQVLNGRNMLNPVGCLQSEKLYRDDGMYRRGNAPRYLRADLFADVSRLYVANKRLSQYGWRHHSWLECKFMRGQAGDDFLKNASNKSPVTGAILADLLRLALLVPEGKNNRQVMNEERHLTKSSRYFLHVYDAEPRLYLTVKRRLWSKKLVSVGSQELHFSNLDKEPFSVKKLIGDLPGLDVKLSVTNFFSGPVHVDHRPIYWCWLTRIDKVEARLGEHKVIIDYDRHVKQTDNGLDEISSFLAHRLAIIPESSDTIPPLPDEKEDDTEKLDSILSDHGNNI
ncbi:hypothetical protein [Pantoea ananatis]|uniref:hypothetical protein n=1 Tax=Pantoea ananas TaxID=553 RepID=UPI000E395A1B|nr:hypothetical protein [Pantoea ananatis]REE67521.1 hypothetical protein C7424_3945 [Pantoea ananatis]